MTLKLVEFKRSKEHEVSVQETAQLLIDSEHVEKVVTIATLEDGTVAIRHSTQKDGDLAWAARALQIYVDEIIRESLEEFGED